MERDDDSDRKLLLGARDEKGRISKLDWFVSLVQFYKKNLDVCIFDRILLNIWKSKYKDDCFSFDYFNKKNDFI